MNNRICLLFLVAFLSVLSSKLYAQVGVGGSWPVHYCCAIDPHFYGCSTAPANHNSEETIRGGGCTIRDVAEYSWCYHEYGPSIWVALNNGSPSACQNDGGFSYGAIGCGYIWCSNGTGGWKLKGVEIMACAGSLQADKTGLTCFSDNNADGIVSTGDQIFQKVGC